MRNNKLFKVLFVFVLIVFVFSANLYSQNEILVKKINFKIYDNEKDTLLNVFKNMYGTGMDLYMSVCLDFKLDSEKKYTLKVEGFGKGRENDAEGIVEDYKIKKSKKLTFYYKKVVYIPFIFDFPCTDYAYFTISILDLNGNTVSMKNVKSKFSYCNMN